MKYWVTGDFHGQYIALKERIKYTEPGDAVIVLGDACFNYYGDKRDKKLKNMVNSLGRTIYCVRGNHEMRPADIFNMKQVFDENIGSWVDMEKEWPNIKYLWDGTKYKINGYDCLIIGGAYSVDKEYRLMRGWNWFSNELLTPEEMKFIEDLHAGKDVDFILSHTCPLSFQPRDMFLTFIDQSKVDNSMETWMEEFKDKINWKYWLFGHYHGDRIIQPGVRMFFNDIVEFNGDCAYA